MSTAGNDRLAADEAASQDAATTPRQMQVRVERETLICSLSLQPLSNEASSLPTAVATPSVT